jgi:hypothetical protein
VGREDIFRLHEFFKYYTDNEIDVEADHLSAARMMLEQYSEEEYGGSPAKAVLESGCEMGRVAPVTEMTLYEAYEQLLKEQETELNAPSYLRSRGDSDPDRHLRESADHVERFLRNKHGYDYDDIFEPVAAI